MSTQLRAQRERLAERMTRYVKSMKGATVAARQLAAASAVGCSLRTVQKAMTKANAVDAWMIGTEALTEFCRASTTSADYILLGKTPASPLADAVTVGLEGQMASNKEWIALTRNYSTGVDGEKVLAFLQRELEIIAKGLTARIEAEMALNTALVETSMEVRKGAAIRVGRQRLAGDHQRTLGKAVIALDAPVRDRAKQLLRDWS